MPSGVYPRTEYHRKITSRGVKRWMTPKIKSKLREWNLKNPQRYWLGKTRSVEDRIRMSEGSQGKNSGPKCRWWKGGITPINYRIRHSKEYQTWRWAVFERDDFTCLHCGIRGVYLEADHIKPFSTHPNLRFEISNGRTLCRDCHRKTDTFGRKSTNHLK